MNQKFEYSTLDVFAAAVKAHQFNGGYFSSYKQSFDDPKNDCECEKEHNSTLMHRYLSNQDKDADAAISESDYAFAKTIIEYYQNKIFDLMNNKLNEYSTACCQAANSQTVSDKKTFNLIASMPVAYRSSLNFDQMLENKQKALRNSKVFGAYGERYTGCVEVISCYYSKKYTCYFVAAKDVITNNVITFGTNENLLIAVGSKFEIFGWIGGHTQDNMTKIRNIKIVVNENQLTASYNNV